MKIVTNFLVLCMNALIKFVSKDYANIEAIPKNNSPLIAEYQKMLNFHKFVSKKVTEDCINMVNTNEQPNYSILSKETLNCSSHPMK